MNIKRLTGGLVLSIGLALSGVALAQNQPQSDQRKDGASCCAMASCCKGDSCSMKDHTKKDQDHAKKDHSKEHSKDGSCCCCKGDSCKMEMKDKKGN